MNNSSLSLSLRKDIDLRMSMTIHKQKTAYKTKLLINEDTSYDIIYDIYDFDEKKYLYIKVDENTAEAPFFYNRSFQLEDLYEINKIFKSCEELDEVKHYIKLLFDNKKISLKYKENKEILTLEIDAILFISPIRIELDIYREMVPEIEKEEKLISLYKINKSKLNKLKEIYTLILKNRKDDKIMELFRHYSVPGAEIALPQ